MDNIALYVALAIGLIGVSVALYHLVGGVRDAVKGLLRLFK